MSLFNYNGCPLSKCFDNDNSNTSHRVDNKHYCINVIHEVRIVSNILDASDLDYIGLGTSFLKDLYVHLNVEYNEISLGCVKVNNK